jgi:hypothetical protein
MFSARSLQHLRPGGFSVPGTVHRVVVEAGRAFLVHRHADRAGVDLPGGTVGTVRGDVLLAGEWPVSAEYLHCTPRI